MDELKLKNGGILLDTIQTTKQSLRLLIELKDKKESKKRKADNLYDDGLYTLNIGEYSDMSGGGAKLARYSGNMELLNAIIQVLTDQLNRYEEEFASM